MAHHAKHPSQEDTQILEPLHKVCPYEKEKDMWFDSKFLKMAGTIIGLLSPLFVWIVVEIFTMKSEIALVKQKQEVLIEMKHTIEEIQKTTNQILVDVAVLKTKETK